MIQCLEAHSIAATWLKSNANGLGSLAHFGALDRVYLFNLVSVRTFQFRA